MSEIETSAAGVDAPARFRIARELRAHGLLARLGLARLPATVVPPNMDMPAPEPIPRKRPSAYLLSFIIIVVIPALAVTAYFALLASDQFVVETRFAVSSVATDMISEKTKPGGPLGAGFSAANDDSYLISAYVRSRGCLDEVSKTLNLREIFSRPEADFWARLKSNASPEELLIYWRAMVESYVDPPSGIVTVTVSAFRREDALAIAEAVLKASEKVANDVSTRAREDVMKIAEDEVARSEKQVAGSLTDLRTFRESAGFIDPKIQAESAGKLLEQLNAQRIRLQTEYSVSSHAMSPEAPTLQALKSRLDQLTFQIAQEKAKLTNQSKGSGTLADLLPKYEELVVHNQFAEKLYTLAADGLERARLRALAQTIYVNVFVPPVLPQEALFPERFASSVVISFVLFILWGIGALTAALVEDHKL
jgi:capsular polysaccharide transport system permease protein